MHDTDLTLPKVDNLRKGVPDVVGSKPLIALNDYAKGFSGRRLTMHIVKVHKWEKYQ